jgi:hypothetical protein
MYKKAREKIKNNTFRIVYRIIYLNILWCTYINRKTVIVL